VLACWKQANYKQNLDFCGCTWTHHLQRSFANGYIGSYVVLVRGGIQSEVNNWLSTPPSVSRFDQSLFTAVAAMANLLWKFKVWSGEKTLRLTVHLCSLWCIQPSLFWVVQFLQVSSFVASCCSLMWWVRLENAVLMVRSVAVWRSGAGVWAACFILLFQVFCYCFGSEFSDAISVVFATFCSPWSQLCCLCIIIWKPYWPTPCLLIFGSWFVHLLCICIMIFCV
jgi:hypothetical protein